MIVYVTYECFGMQMLYVCVLCASCGSSQCCILHDLQFVNAGQGRKWRPYGRAYTRWSCHSGLANPVQIVSTTPAPAMRAQLRLF